MGLFIIKGRTRQRTSDLQSKVVPLQSARGKENIIVMRESINKASFKKRLKYKEHLHQVIRVTYLLSVIVGGARRHDASKGVLTHHCTPDRPVSKRIPELMCLVHNYETPSWFPVRIALYLFGADRVGEPVERTGFCFPCALLHKISIPEDVMQRH